ncbi:hypothetical protein Pelo_19909 [Pelomyxa schiedti]|nr:hypothetical protein Pelo_19909 [Pelomyxa schiedti]
MFTCVNNKQPLVFVCNEFLATTKAPLWGPGNRKFLFYNKCSGVKALLYVNNSDCAAVLKVSHNAQLITICNALNWLAVCED